MMRFTSSKSSLRAAMTDLPAHERYVLAIGSITIVWAMVEMMFDNMVGILFHRFGGHPSEPDLPRTSLSRKIRFARKCFNSNADLAPYRDEAIPLLDRMSELSDERHWCVHGAALDLHKEDAQFTQTKYRAFGNLFLEEHRPITPDDLGDLTIKIVYFSNALCEFILRWIENDPIVGKDAPADGQILHIARPSHPTRKA